MVIFFSKNMSEFLSALADKGNGEHEAKQTQYKAKHWLWMPIIKLFVDQVLI